MNTITNWCDAVFVINLAKRLDRLEQSICELSKIGVPAGTHPKATRFEAYADLIDHNGKPNGNFGCTSSHRALLELIAFHRYNRALVLEDDFMLRPKVEGQLNLIFDAVVRELPDDWRILYLGGSYGENPKRRHSPHLIETNAVMTTSSYIINWRQARHMAPHISGIGPIDSLFHRFNREGGCYMACPRLFVQRPSFSDLTERMAENVTSMEDATHEEMLLDGQVEVLGPRLILNGRLQRRELAAPHDMDGTQVIVEGKLYTILSLQLPQHRASWFRDEPVTYILKEA